MKDKCGIGMDIPFPFARYGPTEFLLACSLGRIENYLSIVQFIICQYISL